MQTLNTSQSYRDRKKTDFTSCYGLYQFVNLQFEVNNAPVNFLRVMDVILLSVKWKAASLLLRWRRRLFQNPWTTYEQSSTCFDAAARCLRNDSSKKCSFSPRPLLHLVTSYFLASRRSLDQPPIPYVLFKTPQLRPKYDRFLNVVAFSDESSPTSPMWLYRLTHF